jgi:hypothetical protein
MKHACENCDFWDKTQDILGICRRDPPKPNPEGEYCLWPITAPGDWCGEFEPRMDEDEPEGE